MLAIWWFGVSDVQVLADSADHLVAQDLDSDGADLKSQF